MQKTAYEMRISDWSSDVCSSDLSTPSGAATRRSPTILALRLNGKRAASPPGPTEASTSSICQGRIRYAPEAPTKPSHVLLSSGADRKSTRLNQSLMRISYAVFCLKKKMLSLTLMQQNTSTPTTDQLHEKSRTPLTSPHGVTTYPSTLTTLHVHHK